VPDLVWSRGEEALVGGALLVWEASSQAGPSLFLASFLQLQCNNTTIVMPKLNVLFTLAVAFGLVLTGCDSSGSNQPAQPEGPDVVEVSAVHDHEAGEHLFDLATDEVPSGWTTFRFDNQGHQPHFLILEKMPTVDGDQKTVEDSKAEVVPVFQNVMDDINGENPSFPDAGFELPAWYSDVAFVGGPGITSSNETSETTVNLEPGTYVVECYVKTEDGTFHSVKGMIEGLTVTDASNGASAPPESSLQLTVSSKDGITVDGAIGEPGEHTVEVTFADQTAYAHFLGHDVHLARLGDGTDMDALGAWMNWAAPGGLAGEAPATFLGGAQDMPGGSTTYLTVDLEAGQYAWIAEVPNPDGKSMLKTFTVD